MQVILAIGGEVNGVAARSVECFTLGFEAWKYCIPQYIITGNATQETRVIPPMRCARYHAAVTYDSYNAYVIGEFFENYIQVVWKSLMKSFLNWQEVGIPQACWTSAKCTTYGRISGETSVICQ